MFLFHYSAKNQIGGRRPDCSALPLNVLKRGSITHYSINFSQHKNFYDFYKSDVLDSFLNSVYKTFRPIKDCKFHRYAEIVNQQRGQDTILEDTRVWLTNSYNSKHFKEFVRGQIQDDITKRIISNDQTGSSWHFKRFKRLTVIVVSLDNSVNIFSS